MVAHVLVDHTSGNVDSLVVLDFEEHLREALEGLRELANSVVHQTQVESAAHEVLLNTQSLLVHFYGHSDQVEVLPLGVLVDELCLALVGQALAVPQLGVVRVKVDRRVVVLVSELKLLVRLPIQEHVSSVEVDRRVVGVLLDGHVEVALRLLELVEMVVSETPVLVVGARWLDSDGLSVVNKSFFELLVLEVTQTQVVVSGRLVVSHFYCFFEVFDGFVQLADSSQADTFVEECLILVVLVRAAHELQSLRVVLDGLLYLVESGLHQGSVVEELAFGWIVLDC